RSVVVLDEPTEGLDPVWRVRLRDVISGLRSDDRVIVIASHDLSELERIADHALVLEAGEVRDVLDIHAPATTVEYRLVLAAPFGQIHAAFPDAERVDDLNYHLSVTNAAELSQRLGGLIALGATVAAVEPVRAGLEERVRTALDGER